MTELFGAFEYEHLDRRIFHGREGKFRLNFKRNSLTEICRDLKFSVRDHKGKMLVTRLVLSGNHGQHLNGRSKPRRQFIEVNKMK